MKLLQKTRDTLTRLLGRFVMFRLKTGKYKSMLGDKFVGFIWAENYDAIVCGFVVWNHGVFLVMPYET